MVRRPVVPLYTEVGHSEQGDGDGHTSRVLYGTLILTSTEIQTTPLGNTFARTPYVRRTPCSPALQVLPSGGGGGDCRVVVSLRRP